jgi:hypothetical protein
MTKLFNEIYFEIFNNFKRYELGQYLMVSKSIRLVIIDVLRSKSNYLSNNVLELQYYEILYSNKNEFLRLPLDMCLVSKDIIKIRNQIVDPEDLYVILTHDFDIVLNKNHMISRKIKLDFKVKRIKKRFNLYFVDFQNNEHKIYIEDFDHFCLDENKKFHKIINERESEIINDNPLIFKDSKQYKITSSDFKMIHIVNKNNDLILYKFEKNIITKFTEFNNNIQCVIFNDLYTHLVTKDNTFYEIDTYLLNMTKTYYNVYKFIVYRHTYDLLLWLL